jgi:transcriptional regulator with XRE-family HTH domain
MQLARDREKKLRELLKEARLAGDLRQTDIASRLGRPQSYVAKVEGGERVLSFIETLDFCKAIGLDPAVLVEQLR